MSVVTNCLLLFSLSEEYVEHDATDEPDTYPVVEQLNTVLPAQHRFARVDHFAGGSKNMEGVVYAMAGNYVDLAWLVAEVRRLPWLYPDWVQLLVKRQSDFVFYWVPLGPGFPDLTPLPGVAP